MVIRSVLQKYARCTLCGTSALRNQIPRLFEGEPRWLLFKPTLITGVGQSIGDHCCQSGFTATQLARYFDL